MTTERCPKCGSGIRAYTWVVFPRGGECVVMNRCRTCDHAYPQKPKPKEASDDVSEVR